MTMTESLGRGVYSIAEAARYVGVDTATVGRWAFGYRDYRSIVDPDLPMIGKRKAFSFLALMEIYLMARFKAVGIAPEKFRTAAGAVASREGIAHPFAFEHLDQFMRHDNRDFFYRSGDDWEQLTGRNRGNITWNEVVEPYLQEVEFESEYARRWFPPNTDRLIVLDPAIRLGAPVISGTRVPTANIMSQVAAGDEDWFVAECYGLSVEQVRAASRFEKRLKKAA